MMQTTRRLFLGLAAAAVLAAGCASTPSLQNTIGGAVSCIAADTSPKWCRVSP